MHPEIACDVTALAEDQYGKIGGSSENSSPVLFCDPLSTRPLDPSERSVRSVGIPFVFQQALGESYRRPNWCLAGVPRPGKSVWHARAYNVIIGCSGTLKRSNC